MSAASCTRRGFKRYRGPRGGESFGAADVEVDCRSGSDEKCPVCEQAYGTFFIARYTEAVVATAAWIDAVRGQIANARAKTSAAGQDNCRQPDT